MASPPNALFTHAGACTHTYGRFRGFMQMSSEKLQSQKSSVSFHEDHVFLDLQLQSKLLGQALFLSVSPSSCQPDWPLYLWRRRHTMSNILQYPEDAGIRNSLSRLFRRQFNIRLLCSSANPNNPALPI